jgi:hypothetical protein
MHPFRLLLRLHHPVSGRSIRLGLASASILALVAAAGPTAQHAAGADVSEPVGSPGHSTTTQPQAEILRGPAVTLSLSVGPPGTVTTVTGSNFPGLQPIVLQWSTGVQYQLPNPVVTRDDGTFVVQFLVVSGDDVYGPRELQAAVSFFGAATLTRANERVVAQAPFLVVPNTAGPPADDLIHALWGSQPFFLRH